ncbi:MAG TPA: hypothetical protein PLC32_03390 [Candidatus Omnitrophota bacterium]|nr:hypothetical protein [Candidatus Omnitrophota bacterium]
MLYFINFLKSFNKTTGFQNIDLNLASRGSIRGDRGFFIAYFKSKTKNGTRVTEKMKHAFVISLVGLFLLCSPGWATISLNINPDYGMVKEEFGSSYSDGTKTIIYIQDAHCNYEAQKNIANILEHLIKEQGIKMVFVEGGSKDSTLSYLRGYGSKEALKSIAEKQLKEGKISGEEYLNLTSDLNFEIYGIEDTGLYNEQRDAFLKIDGYKAELLKFADSLQGALEQLKQKVYSSELRDLEANRKAFEKDQIQLVSYIDYLNNLCQKYRVTSSYYSAFSNLADVISREKTIDYNSIGKEANSALNRLVEVLTEDEKKPLLEEAKSLEGKDQKVINKFYIKIRDMAQNKNVNLSAYNNFVDFTKFVQAFDSANMEAIFRDIAAVNRAITLEAIKGTDQLDLVDIDYGLSLFKKMVGVQLDKSEYDLYLEKKETINPKLWVEKLGSMAAKYRVKTSLAKDTSKIDEMFGQLERFYQLAFERDNAFVERIFSQMKERNLDIAVLITGGFHASNLQALLEKEGAKGVVVYPKVSSLTDDGLYNSRVKEELSSLEKLVSGR